LRACSAWTVSKLRAPTTAPPVEARMPATARVLVDPKRMPTKVSVASQQGFPVTDGYRIRKEIAS